MVYPSRGTSAFIAASISLCSMPLGPLGPLGSCCAAMAWLSPMENPQKTWGKPDFAGFHRATSVNMHKTPTGFRI